MHPLYKDRVEKQDFSSSEYKSDKSSKAANPSCRAVATVNDPLILSCWSKTTQCQRGSLCSGWEERRTVSVRFAESSFWVEEVRPVFDKAFPFVALVDFRNSQYECKYLGSKVQMSLLGPCISIVYSSLPPRWGLLSARQVLC